MTERRQSGEIGGGGPALGFRLGAAMVVAVWEKGDVEVAVEDL
jgi:hypothetical protein